jgi:hypothetical protein
MILFHCTSTFPLSYLIAPSFSPRLSCTFFHSACNFSISHLGFCFWNLVIFLSLVQIQCKRCLDKHYRSICIKCM